MQLCASGSTRSNPGRCLESLPLPASTDKLNVLTALELDQKMTKEEYQQELEKWQGRLNLASRDPRFKSMSLVAVFEGNDGAGKGGAIRRVTQALDAR